MNSKRIVAALNRLTILQVSLVIALIGFAVYYTGLTNPFQGDDTLQIVNNPVVHSITNIRLFFEGSTFYNGGGIAPLTGSYYRPLMTTVFSLLYTLFGAHTFYFHLFQLLLCIGSAILLYLFFRYSFTPLLSLVFALIFLVHPLNSQVVFAIPSMQDALFFFFGILGFWLLLRFHSMRSLVSVALCLFLALLSKEAAMFFVIMAVLYLLWWDRKRLLRFTEIMVVPIVVWSVLRIHAVGHIGHASVAPIDNLSISGRLLTMPSIVLFYFSKLIFPWKLATGYYWVHQTFSFRYILLPLVIDLAVASLIIYLAVVVRRKLPKAQYYTYLFFMAWAVIGLIPYLEIVPLDMTACETWFYFSMVGVLGMIGIVLVAFQSYIKPQWFIVMAVLLVGLLGARTAVRGLDWGDPILLAQKDIVASPGDYGAYTLVAIGLDDQGAFSAAKPYIEQSIDIFPDGTNYATLGYIYDKLGDFQQSEQADMSGLQSMSNPQSRTLLYENAARLMVWFGDPKSNEQFITNALAIYPQDANMWLDLAVLEYQHGDPTDAKEAITQANNYSQTTEVADTYSIIMHNEHLVLERP